LVWPVAGRKYLHVLGRVVLRDSHRGLANEQILGVRGHREYRSRDWIRRVWHLGGGERPSPAKTRPDSHKMAEWAGCQKQVILHRKGFADMDELGFWRRYDGKSPRAGDA